MSEDDQKPPLDAALRQLAEQQRRSLTDHPTPKDLADYHAGELPPEAEARILDHLAICRECSDLLLDLSGFADLKPPEGMPELTDEQVEEDWQALRARMGEGKRPAEVVPIRPVGPPAKPERTYPVWLPVAASLLAVLGFSFGLYKDWQLRKQTQPAWGHIADSGAVERGGGGQSFSAQGPVVVSLVPDDLEEDYSSYEAEIVRNGEVVVRLPLGSLEGEPALTIPAGFLEPGEYRAELYGIKGDRRESLEDVPFEVTP